MHACMYVCKDVHIQNTVYKYKHVIGIYMNKKHAHTYIHGVSGGGGVDEGGCHGYLRVIPALF